MLYSFYELAQQVPNVRLHIMGGIDDQEYADECFSLADKMDLGDRLLFTGRVNIREYICHFLFWNQWRLVVLV